MAYNQLIHCESCGEDYAASYRRCPFCDARPSKGKKAAVIPDEPDYRPTEEEYDSEDYEEGYEEKTSRRQGGRRLADSGSQKPGRGRSILYALSALVILMAVIIVIWKVLPKLSKTPAATPTPDVVESASPDSVSTPAPTPAANPAPVISPDPAPAVSDPAAAEPSAAPVSKPRLNYTDFSITAAYPDPVRLQVTDGEAESWKSSNEKIATVSGNGTVTAVGNGYAVITCTLADGTKLTCDVHVSGKNAASAPASSEAPAQSEAPASGSGASLNYTDFSITADFPQPVSLRVTGGEAESWKSSNEKVATVSGNGTVTAEGNGHAVITCTLTDGTKLTCDVYVSSK